MHHVTATEGWLVTFDLDHWRLRLAATCKGTGRLTVLEVMLGDMTLAGRPPNFLENPLKPVLKARLLFGRYGCPSKWMESLQDSVQAYYRLRVKI